MVVNLLRITCGVGIALIAMDHIFAGIITIIMASVFNILRMLSMLEDQIEEVEYHEE